MCSRLGFLRRLLGDKQLLRRGEVSRLKGEGVLGAVRHQLPKASFSLLAYVIEYD